MREHLEARRAGRRRGCVHRGERAHGAEGYLPIPLNRRCSVRSKSVRTLSDLAERSSIRGRGSSDHQVRERQSRQLRHPGSRVVACVAHLIAHFPLEMCFAGADPSMALVVSAPQRSRDDTIQTCVDVSRVIHLPMADVTVRDLRNNGGRVLQRVAEGESLTVTMDGRPIAELRPLPGTAVPAATLLRRWRHLPPVDVAALRADLDRALDASL